MSNNSSQTVWMGLSFLVLGLMGGLLFSRGEEGFASLFRSPNQDAVQIQGGGSLGDSEPGPSQEPEFDIESLETVAVSMDDDAVLGDPNAPVTIVEFSDYQCPYCAKFYSETLPLLKENYIDTGKVKLIYRDFPLPIHDQADEAAQAAECVAEAGGDYYAFHDWIFENASKWETEDVIATLIAAAKELGTDISACLQNGDTQNEVNEDYTAGKSYGVSGTPTFFINGKKLVGAYPYETFVELIEAQL